MIKDVRPKGKAFHEWHHDKCHKEGTEKDEGTLKHAVEVTYLAISLITIKDSAAVSPTVTPIFSA